MSDSDNSLQGWEPKITGMKDLCEALEKAFDYRGDVTLMLKNSETVEGFLFNRDFRAPVPFVTMYPAEEDSAARNFNIADIDSLIFSGKDTATGNSWESWVAKWEAKHGPRS